jgi:iron complex outermembrane receptor protein
VVITAPSCTLEQIRETIRAKKRRRGSNIVTAGTRLVRLRLVIASVIAVTSLPVAAQELDLSDTPVVDEIIVTGSRIKRRDLDSPSPTSTIDRAAIEASPQATIEELLNQMPQLTPDYGRTSNNPGNGSAQLNLRGLGPGRSLVMLNSRRLAPSGSGSAIDVNNIPQALIDRVEIITGGASTVYGSDALAGVINFITRDDFEGFSLEAAYGVSQQGDGGFTDINLAYGTDIADGRGNITLFGGHYERQSLYAGEREFSSVVIVEDRDLGELYEGGSPMTPSGVIGFPLVNHGPGPSATTFNADGTPRAFDDTADLYNYAAVNYLQTPLRRYNVGVMARFEINDSVELYLESALTNNKSERELAATPAFDITIVNIDNPLLTPETRQLFADNFEVQPGIAGFFMMRRLDELGPRRIENEREYFRTVLGMRGDLGRDWGYDAWVMHTQSNEREVLFGDASRARYLQGFLVPSATGACYDPSGGCVPIDAFGSGRISPESAEFIGYGTLNSSTERTQQLASFYVTGPVADLDTGSIDVAIGAEWRRDEVNTKTDAALLTGDTMGFRGDAPVDGTESVSEAYFEALIPLYQGDNDGGRVELELGGRLSRYDFAGDVGTHKIGMTWRPNDNLLFRAMKQRSVRAPNNLEQFQEQFIEPGFFVVDDASDDPCSASQDPVGSGHSERCVIQGLPESQLGIFEAVQFYPASWVYGGNPALRPEEGETFTAGVVISPVAWENWNFTIDFYEIEVRDGIGVIFPRNICFDVENTGYEFCDKMVRDATGNVVEVQVQQQNKALVSTRGIDTQILFEAELPDWFSLTGDAASLDIHFVWTHVLSAQNQEDVTSSRVECVGYFETPCGGVNGTAVQDQVNARFGYRSGPLSISLGTRWIGGTKSFAPLQTQYFGGSDPVLAIDSVGSMFYSNLAIGYEINDRASLGFNIENLLDGDPPLMPHIHSNNTDTLRYDVFGRSFTFTLNMNFGN